MVSQLESCYSQDQSYAGCATSQDVTQSGIATGTADGQVELSGLTTDDFVVTGHSKSTNDFTITKTDNGAPVRRCTATGNGGCPSNGSW
jgi:hypothetical protein